MNIKVSVPKEPVCTIKLEITEAHMLLGALTLRTDIAPADKAEAIRIVMAKALADELGVDLEESLFKEGQA